MKKIFFIAFLVLYCTAFSQVIISDNIGTVPTGQKASVLLEFASGQNKGIILPYVRTVPSGTSLVEGTFIVDATDITKAKVKYYNGVITTNTPNGWFDLSNTYEANITSVMSIQPIGIAENNSSKVIIGATSSSADGVLVLESTTKAMVLPMIQDTNDVKDPAPGMMVYINKTGAKRLAVYNGGGWTYWKP